MVATAVIGTVVGGAMAADAQGDAADTAAAAQGAASSADIAERRRQFDAMRALMQPYVNAGTQGLGAQQALLGLSGAEQQQAAIRGIQQSPMFTSLLAQGENSILQNASATGGLRGGNTQGALAQFSPALLAQSINDQYARLGGMTSIGQNAAAGVGNAGMQTGAGIGAALQQGGAAQAGAALAGGRAQAGMINSIAGGIGMLGGMGGFGGFGGFSGGGAGTIAGGTGISPTGGGGLYSLF